MNYLDRFADLTTDELRELRSDLIYTLDDIDPRRMDAADAELRDDSLARLDAVDELLREAA